MKHIEHRIFLKRNQLDKAIVFQPIQEKIEIFDRMHQLLDTVSDTEKATLLEQLEALDLEITEDIDEAYADKLEFNAIEEALEAPVALEKSKQTKSKKEEPKDVSILRELIKIKAHKSIGRSALQDLGFTTALGWRTVIGPYRVRRTSVFAYKYRIEFIE